MVKCMRLEVRTTGNEEVDAAVAKREAQQQQQQFRQWKRGRGFGA